MKMSYVGGRCEFNKPIAKFIVKKLGTGSQIKEGFHLIW